MRALINWILNVLLNVPTLVYRAEFLNGGMNVPINTINYPDPLWVGTSAWIRQNVSPPKGALLQSSLGQNGVEMSITRLADIPDGEPVAVMPASHRSTRPLFQVALPCRRI
jgi:hypothetical protein